MDDKEKKVQNALGTMKSQMFLLIEHDTDGIVDDLREALENFGLYIYEDPAYLRDLESYLIISNEKLTDRQIDIICLDEDTDEEES